LRPLDSSSALARLAAAVLSFALAASASAIDLQGHRGARGLAPENTLAGFRLALGIGVTTLETDLAMTKDGVLVLSHDPYLNPALTRDAQGYWIAEPIVIRTLSSDQLANYDVGRLRPDSKYAQQWPAQAAADGERMPTLAQLFSLARDARSPGGQPVRFNIETKITPNSGTEVPDPVSFAAAVVAAIKGANMNERVTVQSFDWRTLVEIRKIAPEIPTVCLTIASEGMNTLRSDGGGPSPWHAGLSLTDAGGSVPRLARMAGCSAWSPFWRNLKPEDVTEAHASGVRVVPWTVNDESEMLRLAKLGVDGIITDYPDRARKALSNDGIAID
jgi:glycerophosphoryl diester phosphodiesterase